VGARLNDQIRDDDMAGWWGGEEFLVVLPATTARAAMTVAERIRETVVDQPYRLPDGGTVVVTISIGCAASANGHADALVRSADAAL